MRVADHRRRARPASSSAPPWPAAATRSPSSTATRARRADGSWPRRGVMQFHHAHAFRPQVGRRRCGAELPEAYERLAGGRRRAGRAPAAGRRRAARRGCARAGRPSSARCAAPPPAAGADVRAGTSTRCVTDGGPGDRAASSTARPAGRPGHRRLGPVGPGHPPPCGRRRRSAAPAGSPTSTGSTSCTPAPSRARWSTRSPGRPTSTATRCIVFLHERGIFSVLIIRPTDDRGPRRPAARGGVRGGLPRDPRARDVDRPGPLPADHRRAAGRRADELLPRPDRPRRRAGAARAAVRRRLRVHHDPDLRPRHHDVAAAGAGAAGVLDGFLRPRVRGRGLQRLVRAHMRPCRGPRPDGRHDPALVDGGPVAAPRRSRSGRGAGGPRSADAGRRWAVEHLARAEYASGWRPEPDPGPSRGSSWSWCARRPGDRRGSSRRRRRDSIPVAVRGAPAALRSPSS